MSHKLTQQFFEIDGKPLVIAPRFRPLFNAIFYRKHDRVNCIYPTQDGKSTTIAAATVLVAASCPERFTITAPSEKKADIIMTHVRNFATQHPIISSQLELDRTDTLDRLRRERSRKNLTFKRLGGVQTLTLDARNSKRSLEAAMGFGSKNIIQDEAGLIDDPIQATVVRMLGGDIKGSDQKKILIKVGNPFYNNHFKRSSQSKRYKQIGCDYRDSIKDYLAGYYGFKPEFIEEMREEALFDVLYECLFPDEDLIDDKGYRQLILSKELKVYDAKKTQIKPKGIPRLGCDIGGGGDYNVFTKRWDNIACVVHINRSTDTMVNVTEIEKQLDADSELLPENVSIDDIGVGRGVSDRCIEKGLDINPVNVGSNAVDTMKYQNLKAELNWQTRRWLKRGGMLEDYVMNYKSVWNQATWIKYKINSDKQIKIEPKVDLKKRTGKSPDFWESLSLTFAEKEFIGIV